ncbi:50S ribosomal protein L37ae [Candidatus Micrarchaeota archaeon]|nr:50S ribosomal protein L37ae [Candidatus Micrarchaeota archaeon]MBU1930335.1 50S ribosomal protein L37ae [Candidatus Micrarchaeota archaeon]
MSPTRKVKSAGRYGARYGIGIRRRLLKVESKQKKPHPCPYCDLKRLKRKAAGIFYCTKCKIEFAGGAYFPQTLTGGIVEKMIRQKSFLPSVGELVEATEETKHPAEAVVETKTESKKTSKK